jgi:hypothetical protein
VAATAASKPPSTRVPSTISDTSSSSSTTRIASDCSTKVLSKAAAVLSGGHRSSSGTRRRTNEAALLRWSQLTFEPARHAFGRHRIGPVTREALERARTFTVGRKGQNRGRVATRAGWATCLGHGLPPWQCDGAIFFLPTKLRVKRNEKSPLQNLGRRRTARESAPGGDGFFTKSVGKCPRSFRTPDAVPCRGLRIFRDRRAESLAGLPCPPKDVTAPIPWAATGSLCRECHGYATARKGKGPGARSRGRVLKLPVPARRWRPAFRSRL